MCVMHAQAYIHMANTSLIDTYSYYIISDLCKSTAYIIHQTVCSQLLLNEASNLTFDINDT